MLSWSVLLSLFFFLPLHPFRFVSFFSCLISLPYGIFFSIASSLCFLHLFIVKFVSEDRLCLPVLFLSVPPFLSLSVGPRYFYCNLLVACGTIGCARLSN